MLHGIWYFILAICYRTNTRCTTVLRKILLIFFWNLLWNLSYKRIRWHYFLRSFITCRTYTFFWFLQNILLYQCGVFSHIQHNFMLKSPGVCHCFYFQVHWYNCFKLMCVHTCAPFYTTVLTNALDAILVHLSEKFNGSTFCSAYVLTKLFAFLILFTWFDRLLDNY